MTDTAVKKSRRTPLMILGVVLFGAAVLLYYFFGGEAPGAVNIDSAVAAVTTGVATSAVVGTEVAPVADATEAIEGTWTIDTTVGEFSVTEDTAATFAGFRVNEVLDAIGETVAVGRTPNVGGTLEIAGTTLNAANINVDLTSIVSDRARRENAIQRTLNTSANPQATFVLAESIDLGAGAETGETVDAERGGRSHHQRCHQSGDDSDRSQASRGADHRHRVDRRGVCRLRRGYAIRPGGSLGRGPGNHGVPALVLAVKGSLKPQRFGYTALARAL